jgi:hypothetical protein
MHHIITVPFIFLFVIPVQLLSQDPQPIFTTRQLFGQQLLFIEYTKSAMTDLLIAQVVPPDSMHPADTIYLDTIPLSMCDQWELDRNVSCGVWELHGDTLIFWYRSHKTFTDDAGSYDPAEERTWKKTYVIRKNLEVVLLSTGYGQMGSGIVNKNLNDEVLRKTKSAYRVVGRLCY